MFEDSKNAIMSPLLVLCVFVIGLGSGRIYEQHKIEKEAREIIESFMNYDVDESLDALNESLDALDALQDAMEGFTIE